MIRILEGDCRDVLKTLDASSVHCVVTSPPYYGLRDYGTASWEGGDPECDHLMSVNGVRDKGRNRAVSGGTFHDSPLPNQIPQQFKNTCGKCGATRIDSQIGLEASPDLFIAELVSVFREVWRVLRNDGTCWLNLGDSYNSSPPGNKVPSRLWAVPDKQQPKTAYNTKSKNRGGLKPKDLMMIPARVAIALQADGWYLRSDIIWNKPSVMPESVTDRPTTAHEHVFLLTKKPQYFYDAEAVKEITGNEMSPEEFASIRHPGRSNDMKDFGGGRGKGFLSVTPPTGRNLRNVWTIATQALPDSHFAAFPKELASRCIRAGTSEHGCCPACGAPWERITTKGEPDQAHRVLSGADSAGGYQGQSTKDHDAHGVQNASDVKRRILDGMRHKTYDWQPTCECHGHFEACDAPAEWISDATGERKKVNVWVPDADVPPVVPCTVLDPFAGAGTTGMAANDLGRNAVLIELSPKYCTMMRKRITRDREIEGSFFVDTSIHTG